MGVLEGKVAVITGSGRGIGRGMALLFAQHGAKIVVVDPGVNVDGTGNDDGPADQVVGEIKAAGGEAVSSYESVATMAGGEKIIQTALDSFGRLDILVNNAGILRDRMIFNMSEEEWDAVIAVHLKGHFACAKPASVVFRQQRCGRIINFTSVSGLVGIAGQANYGAAKSGVAGFTRVVARDLGRYGVTCNAISPGAATRMTATVPDAARQRSAQAGIQRQPPQAAQAPRPDGRPSGRDPDLVAPMAAYLACDDAWNINGYNFGVAGTQISVLHHPTPFRTIWKPGLWTLDELIDQVPNQLMTGIGNPAPPPPELDIRPHPGRGSERHNMIKGVHALFYTTEPEAARAFLRDQLGLAFHDEGEGWLIFDFPEGEIGCHPSDRASTGVTLYCDDLDATMAEAGKRGVAFTAIVEEEWGRVTTFDLPGGGPVTLYQPKYARG